MTIHFENAGERRKELVQALVDATGCEKKYLGAPSFAYAVGDYTVMRDGSVDVNELLDEKELGLTLHALRANGFIPTGDTILPYVDAPTKQEIKPCVTTSGVDGITLSFPKDMDEREMDNLRKLVAAKAPLIRLALELETDELPIEVRDEQMAFPWLPGTAPNETVQATMFLIMGMIRLAKRLGRVTATTRATDNPRYAFRCFLLRLGFIGDEYKPARKVLMRGIPGNGSRRYFTPEDAEPTAGSEPPIEIEESEKL